MERTLNSRTTASIGLAGRRPPPARQIPDHRRGNDKNDRVNAELERNRMAFLDADPEIDDGDREPYQDEQPCAVGAAAFATPAKYLEDNVERHRECDADDRHQKSTHGVSPT